MPEGRVIYINFRKEYMKTNEAINILEQIATIPSLSGEEKNVGKKLCEILTQVGCTVRKIPVDDGGFNVVGTVGDPKILFASHMDTVSGGKPFSKSGNAFYGRGVCDAKASIAAMIAAAKSAIVDNLTNFGLAFTVGEETTFRGAEKLVSLFQPFPFTIVGEPTSLDLVNAQFGCASYTITANGKAAHSSKPNEGINAIDLIVQAIEKSKSMKMTGKTFFSVCKIAGGVADNIIPDTASAVLSFRTDPGDNADYKAMIQNTVGNSISVTEDFLMMGVSTTIPKELNFLKQTARTVTYGSELSLYKNGIILGPGDIAVAHSDDEVIDLAEVKKASELYKKIIQNFQ